MITPDTMTQAALHHEGCVAIVKSELESRGFTVSRIGYYDILPSEYYEKQPLSIRLTQLYPDLKARCEKKTLYFEVKAEIRGMVIFSHAGLQSENGETKLNALQLAFFINLYRQTGEPTVYVLFLANGAKKVCYPDDIISKSRPRMDGNADPDPDVFQYCMDAFNWWSSSSKA